MKLPVVFHKNYNAQIGDDHKFPINKFEELAYLIKILFQPYPCSDVKNKTLKIKH